MERGRDIHELVIDRISLIMNVESSLHLVERDHKDLLRRIQEMEDDKEMMEFDAEMEDEYSIPFPSLPFPPCDSVTHYHLIYPISSLVYYSLRVRMCLEGETFPPSPAPSSLLSTASVLVIQAFSDHLTR